MRFNHKLRQIAITTAIASLFSITNSFAMLEDRERGYHPYSPCSIFSYDVNASVDDVKIGSAAGIDQGAHGDCWFESAMAALARFPAGTRLLSEMITEEGGVYFVRFLDEPHPKWKVTQTDISNANLIDSAPWANVLEAAMMKRYPQMQTGGNINHTFEAAIGGEPTSVLGLTMLTGHQASYKLLADMTQDELEHLLEFNLASNVPMTASTKQNIPSQAVVPKHCYTVLAYDPGSSTITVRNPWGKNISKTYTGLPTANHSVGGVSNLGNGIMQMSISSFIKYYSLVTWSRVFHL